MGFAQGLVYRTSESGEKGMMETSTDHVQRVVGRKREKGTSLDFFHPRFPYNWHKNIPQKLILGDWWRGRGRSEEREKKKARYELKQCPQ